MKHFLINPSIESIDKSEIEKIRDEKELIEKELYEKRLQKNNEKLRQLGQLNHTHGRVVITVDVEGKNSHTFSNGQKIYIGREFNNLNKRETAPVNAFVISGENIEKGAEILVHHNAIIESHRIYNYNDDELDVKYYSIPETQCYLWKGKDGKWNPMKNFATGLRLFMPYKGNLVGVEPTLIPDVLYITSGEYKGKVAHTLRACDYEIIYMGESGTEERIIRIRHYEKEFNEKEEIVGISNILTKKVLSGEILVGLSKSDAKFVNFDKNK